MVPPKPKHRRNTVAPQPQTKRPLQVGDRVYVHTLDSEGEVLSLDDEVEVQVGVLRVRVKPDQVERRGGKPSAEEKPEVEIADYKAPTPKSPGLELDMRGMRVEEGMLVLEDYIDRAYLAGLPWARILHGKGSGALRKAVREKLHGHELIKDYKAAPRHEGGDGVTVVYFAELV
ncbi:MAG: Smr/MutS family protein [Anaerolineae bacterium]